MKSMIACLGILCLTTSLLADPPAANKDVAQIIKQADEATRKILQTSYNHKVFGLDGLEEFVPPARGQVRTLRKSTMEESPFWVESDETATDGPFGSAPKVIVSFDGTNVYRLDMDAQTLDWGAISDGASELISRNDSSGLMIEFVHPTPFQDEIDADSQKLEGTETIGGVKCDVVYVVYSGAAAEARWFFGQKDHLPRRVERVFPGQGRLVTEVLDLDVKTKVAPEVFVLKAPKGFKTVKYEPQRPADKAGAIEIGSAAPDFALKNPDGDTVRLSDLHGNVVLIDFWATWCGPCKRAMPGIQKLHKKFKDKNVKVYGIDVWDQDGDPVGFMKENEYTYGLLLNGDDVAAVYGVSGIPTFYVIDAKGQVAFTASGFGEGTDEQLDKIITGLLEKIEN